LREGRHPLHYFAAVAHQVVRSLVRLPLPAYVGTNSAPDYEPLPEASQVAIRVEALRQLHG